MAFNEPEMIFGEQEGLAKLVGGDPHLADRVRYFPISTPAVIERMGFGIVFVMAWWSGPARSYWVALKEFLTALDSEGKLEVAVLDIDGMKDFERSTVGPTIRGAGELAWVRDGHSVIPGWALWGGDAIGMNTRLFLEGRELFVSKTWLN
jgi:hypothetical protein